MIDDPEQISASLRKVLNTHGHGFHYAVVRRGEELSDRRESPWFLNGTEVPVVAGGAATHIDFVLSTRSERTYLVGECKRADPAKARWCFARAPYRWQNDSEQELIFDELVLRADRTHYVRPLPGYMERGSYQLGFELRTGQQGDGDGGRRRDIEDAIAQVLRSASGLINQLSGSLKFPTESERAIRFIPAIFTTAQLWTTEADLGAADLSTGNLSVEQVKAQKADWVWFTYNRSPHLSHGLPYESRREDLSSLLRLEFARSIAIVGTEGIDNFLKRDLEAWLR